MTLEFKDKFVRAGRLSFLLSIPAVTAVRGHVQAKFRCVLYMDWYIQWFVKSDYYVFKGHFACRSTFAVPTLGIF